VNFIFFAMHVKLLLLSVFCDVDDDEWRSLVFIYSKMKTTMVFFGGCKAVSRMGQKKF